jgi:hypothetical protein
MLGHLVTKSRLMAMTVIALLMSLSVSMSGCETISQLKGNPSTPRTSYDIVLGPKDRIRGSKYDNAYKHYRCQQPLILVCELWGSQYDCTCQ